MAQLPMTDLKVCARYLRMAMRSRVGAGGRHKTLSFDVESFDRNFESDDSGYVASPLKTSFQHSSGKGVQSASPEEHHTFRSRNGKSRNSSSAFSVANAVSKSFLQQQEAAAPPRNGTLSSSTPLFSVSQAVSSPTDRGSGPVHFGLNVGNAESVDRDCAPSHSDGDKIANDLKQPSVAENASSSPKASSLLANDEEHVVTSDSSAREIEAIVGQRQCIKKRALRGDDGFLSPRPLKAVHSDNLTRSSDAPIARKEISPVRRTQRSEREFSRRRSESTRASSTQSSSVGAATPYTASIASPCLTSSDSVRDCFCDR